MWGGMGVAGIQPLLHDLAQQAPNPWAWDWRMFGANQEVGLLEPEVLNLCHFG